ncbi:hypothetical protein NW762_014547 [Fusarium torreyae]|uniref:CHAT domain-containing protein n=1 Tax=Fusarium torreyae TaxID=1237075 RepID=A0A9W8V7N0_9HYPO|nr:hypothetical protein NW762_014547 [Fusarium torreyae]
MFFLRALLRIVLEVVLSAKAFLQLLLPPPDPLAQGKKLNKLAERSFSRYTQTGSLLELEKCIDLHRQMIKCTPSAYVIDHAGLLGILALRLRERYDRTRMKADLDEACRALKQASQANHPDRGSLLCQLGVQLAEKFEQTRDTSLLDEAIRVSRQAIACIPDTHPELPNFLGNLGNRIGERFSQTGNTMDLEEAIYILRTANQSAPTTYADRPAILMNLALQLGESYSWTGNVADLNEGIIIARESIDCARDRAQSSTSRLGTLATLLFYRFSRSGGMHDLDEAIQKRRQIVQAIPKHHNDRAGHLNNLANLLLAKNSRSGALSDVNEAIEIIREAIDDTDDSNVYKAAMLDTLATLLGTRASQGHKDEDLVEAIRISRQAVQVAPDGRPERVRYLNNLTKLLGTRYSKTESTVDLEEAIKAAQQAVEAAPSNFPDRASLLSNLGIHVAESYSRTNNPTSFDKAKECFISALYHKPSPIQHRLTAGRYFLLLPGILEDLDQAYDVAKVAVELVPLLNSPSLQHVDRQALLQQAVAIASDAAAIALLHGKGAAHAVELLEIGRNVIASSLQDLRTDLFMLKKKHPDLASRFSHLRKRLDAPLANESMATVDTIRENSLGADQRRQAEDQLPTLLRDIRAKSGFENFLLAPSAAEIQATAKDGPIVIINISQFRCDALIMELSGTRTVPLPYISWDTIHHRDRGTLETLEWLWDDIVSPVFDALGLTQQPSDDHWPHIWWIPTGRLVGFPLHAAGYHIGPNSETALDRAVSSYSSSVKTLIHSRRQQGYRPQETRADADLVLVSMDVTPEQDNLEHATEEIRAIRNVVGNSTTLSPKEPLSLKKDVLSALRSCSVFHFAGHGRADPLNPLQSCLLLSDWQKDPLSVESVLDINLGREMPFLAYLSACGSGKIQVAGLVDEAIHMTTAFQLSGFQHVIGTLWDVNDKLCVDIARMMYDGLLQGHMRDEAVSRSLHRATRELRDHWASEDTVQDLRRRDGKLRKVVGVERTPVRPLWVPYVHYGI